MYKQMKSLLRKLLVIIVLFAPLFVNTDCKKQKRCGCPPRGDIIRQYNYENAVYFNDESTMVQMFEYYDSYTFCNPDRWREELKKYKSGDALVVKGDVYWDCSWVMQASNNPQGSLGASYQIYVDTIYMEMYGKNKIEKGAE